MQTPVSEIVSTLTTLRDYMRWAASRFTQAKSFSNAPAWYAPAGP